jgi:predicted transcriptional regulator
VSTRREEILTDPANHAVLKTLAQEEKISIEELGEETGLREERVRKKADILEEENFLDRKAGELVFGEEHREEIQELKEGVENFSELHEGNISESLEEHSQEIEEIRGELEEQKNETNLVTREKEIERKLELLEEAVDGEESGLEELAKASRARKLFDHETDMHGFHAFRKHKTREKAEQILETSPEEEEDRRFFGNRWVSKERLSN